MLVRDKTKGARMNRRQYSTWTVYGPVYVYITVRQLEKTQFDRLAYTHLSHSFSLYDNE